MTLAFHFSAFRSMKHDEKAEKIALSWDDIFLSMGMTLMSAMPQDDIWKTVAAVVFRGLTGSERFAVQLLQPAIKIGAYSVKREDFSNSCALTIESTQVVLKQFAALDLIEPHSVSHTKTDLQGHVYSTLEDAWRLTTRGREKDFNAVALPTTLKQGDSKG